MKIHVSQEINGVPLFAGFDLGSRSVKIAVQYQNSSSHNTEIVLIMYDTVDFYENYLIRSEKGLEIDLVKLGLESSVPLVLTGYGRETATIKGAQIISEIKAHVLGVGYQMGLQDFVLLDMGGQDTKVAEVRDGKIFDFRTNDSCAASTGRYLENMARILSMDLLEMMQISENPVELSSVCAVFAETELLSLMAEGHTKASLASGVNHSLVRRISPLIPELKQRPLVITGGVSASKAIIGILSEKFDTSPKLPEFPRFNGAIGCLSRLLA